MDNKKFRAVGAAVLAVIWLGLAVFAWFKPAQDMSLSERRKLDKFPALTAEAVLEGDFMTDFEEYTLDQFPLRDTFRQIKARFHYQVLAQKDNNDIFLYDGYAAKLEYPLNESSVKYATDKFTAIYEKYLKDNGCENLFVSVVPDKSYYVGDDSGILKMDYEKMFSLVQQGTPWAQYVDLTGSLSLEDYYYTDTHWRQEKILKAAEVLCQALQIPAAEGLSVAETKEDFYGVYYGQAALPMEAEPLYTLRSPLIQQCTVFNHELNRSTQVYDMPKLSGTDPYDVYLSGATALLTIENPSAETDRELIVFRDSFGSSMIPLLLQGYKTVTVVDLRYIASDYLPNFLEFHGQDVLFLYSTLVLNSAFTLK